MGATWQSEAIFRTRLARLGERLAASQAVIDSAEAVVQTGGSAPTLRALERALSDLRTLQPNPY
jgi:hypothetical protein